MENFEKLIKKSKQRLVVEGPEDFLKLLKGIKDPVIEIAGPTKGGYPFIGISDLKSFFEKVFISNIVIDQPVYDKGSFSGYERLDLDLLASAINLPFQDETIGAVFCSYLPKTREPSPYVIDPNERSKFTMTQLTADMIRGKEISPLRKNAIEEAYRVLKRNGFLIWQGGEEVDYKFAEQLGFRIIKLVEKCDDLGNFTYDFVAQKI